MSNGVVGARASSSGAHQSSHYYEEAIHEHHQRQHHHPQQNLNRRSSAGSTRFHDARYESSQSIASSSKPREIECSLNDSIDSVPFSIDGMEKAKRKIKSQAARIRDLEEKLEFNASIGGDSSDEKSSKRVLSSEERLEAHRERKNLENKYKEKSGKWTSPEQTKRSQSITKKVKRRDEFVERLAAGPTERKRHDEVKARMSRSMATLNDDEKEYRDDSPLVRRHTVDEELRSLSAKKKKKSKGRHNVKKGGQGRESLMRRLNMGVEERRDKDKENKALDAAKRVHVNSQKRLSRESSNSTNLNSEAPERRGASSGIQDSRTKSVPRCQTCGSKHDCEADTDDPDIYYCAPCWDEYENESTLDRGFEAEDEELSCVNSVQLSSSQDSDQALWIVHDNPTLGNRLVCSGTKKMSCLIETKDPRTKNCMRILHATIDYSGPVVNSGGRMIRDIEETDRGAECIRLGNVWGFIINHDEVETRLSQNNSVHQFQLDKDDALPLTGLNAQANIKDFLKGCMGSVDVILDPQSSSGGWYPIREANGTRKIAPQFRSRGIGYIRLGDDMGMNGQAFMSNDCCKTFLLNESVEREELNRDVLKTVSSFSSKPSFRSKSPRSRHSQNLPKSLNRKHRDSHTANSTVKSSVYEILSEGGDEESSISSHSTDCEETIPAGEVLKDLENIEGSKLKWKEKADLLIKLGKAVSKPEGRAWCEGALNYLQDIVSAKNVNIHVLRSALSVVNKIGNVLEGELPNHIAWRTIMIELLKLLKNKQCGGGAREILQQLHGKCYTLGNSLTAIAHVLGINKALATSQKKTNLKKTNSNLSVRPKQAPTMNANNIEVVEWLAVTTEAESTFDEEDTLNPPMEASELELLATFFLSHESHRDARCRKNALDGLLHTMLYGINILGMSADEVQSFCLELKTSKPKSWTRLTKSLNTVLKGTGKRKQKSRR